MDMETFRTVIVPIITAAGTLIASGALFIVRIKAALKENKELKKKKDAETALRLREERDKFYLTTASNLVLSAERLNLTGAQKKEYVMTWLENEIVKAGLEINKAAMSTAIERVILIMNDHRHLDKPVAEIIEADIQKMTDEEQARIEAETAAAFEKIQADKQKHAAEINGNTNTAKDLLDGVTDLLGKSTKKIGQ